MHRFCVVPFQKLLSQGRLLVVVGDGQLRGERRHFFSGSGFDGLESDGGIVGVQYAADHPAFTASLCGVGGVAFGSSVKLARVRASVSIEGKPNSPGPPLLSHGKKQNFSAFA